MDKEDLPRGNLVIIFGSLMRKNAAKEHNFLLLRGVSQASA